MSDVDRRVGAAFGVTRPADDVYAAFPQRFSFLIDPDGVIARSYDVANVAEHADDVLADLERLRAR